ncbi:MAG TPA: RNA methyltransferase [Burkholderiales bacterium]
MTVLRSRDNPQVKRWARLARDARLRRSERKVLIEGPHLIAAAMANGIKPLAILAAETALPHHQGLLKQCALEPIMLSDSAFKAIADTETPQGIAAEIPLPELEREGAWVFLEGVQDAGNVGAIIRSAAAFGAGRVVLDRQCADPWSPKVLRAGMGGHFALGIRQVDDLPSAARASGHRLLCTAMNGRTLAEVDVSGQIGWVFGSEGAGLSRGMLALAAARVAIPMAAGTESLNVAAAAAICLYEGFSRRAARS